MIRNIYVSSIRKTTCIELTGHREAFSFGESRVIKTNRMVRKRNFPCEHCSNRFRDNYDLQRHISRCHDDCGFSSGSTKRDPGVPSWKVRKKKHICNQCDHGFRDLRDLHRHKQSTHVALLGSKRAVVRVGRPRSRSSCSRPGCSWRAYHNENRGSLEGHLVVHGGGRVLMYCERCQKKFRYVGEFSTARFGHLLYNRCMAVCCFVSTHYIIHAGAIVVLVCF